MAEIKVGKVEEIGTEKGKLVEIDGKAIAVFKVDDGFRAIDNTCPHAAGPLVESEVDEEKNVMCPWHGYMFNVETGEGVNFPTGVKTYKTRVENGEVFVEV